ncbi:hypothetical protein EZS27_037914, partial [termite gut metagenome]
ECREMLASDKWKKLTGIRICGMMGMASNIDCEEQIRHEFDSLRNFFVEIKKNYFPTQSSFCELSMGMSHDYHIAIETGSTLVRIGSKIFGIRK